MRYRFGDLVLDTESYRLNQGGEPRSVEPLAFDLLAYLVTNRDRVVTRDELLNSSGKTRSLPIRRWGPDYGMHAGRWVIAAIGKR